MGEGWDERGGEMRGVLLIAALAGCAEDPVGQIDAGADAVSDGMLDAVTPCPAASWMSCTYRLAWSCLTPPCSVEMFPPMESETLRLEVTDEQNNSVRVTYSNGQIDYGTEGVVGSGLMRVVRVMPAWNEYDHEYDIAPAGTGELAAIETTMSVLGGTAQFRSTEAIQE